MNAFTFQGPVISSASGVPSGQAFVQQRRQKREDERQNAFRQALSESADESGNINPQNAFQAAKKYGVMPEMMQFAQQRTQQLIEQARAAQAMNQSQFGNQLKQQTLEETIRHNRAVEAAKTREIGGSAETDPTAPWRHINDPKKRDEAKTRFGLEADRALAKEQEDVAKAQGVNQALDRFLQLNEQTGTGAAYDLPLVGGIAQTAASFNPDFKELQSLQDRLTPAMRQGMPGAASDRDVAMFKSATVGVGKPLETNRNVATGLKAANQNQIDRFNFMNTYATEKGHLRGAEQEWKKYLEANPIFDPKQPTGSYVLNQNRQTYEQWKTKGGGTTDTATPKIGDIQDGYMYTGGNPSDPKSWKKSR